MANKHLYGTYGLFGQNGTTDDNTLVIKHNSYCAGTRDENILITTNNTSIGINNNFRYFFKGPEGTVIDGVVKIPGIPVIKFTTVIVYDADAGENRGYIDLSSNATTGTIELEIVTVNNYPLKQSGPSITVVNIDTNNKEPKILVYLNKYTEDVGTVLTGTVSLFNLVIGDQIVVNFTGSNGDNYILNPDLENYFTVTSSTMVFPLIINSSIFSSLQDKIVATVLSNVAV